MSDKRFTVKLSVSQDVRRELRVIAAQQDVNVSDLLREALGEYLQKRGINLDLKEGLDTWGGAGRKSAGE